MLLGASDVGATEEPDPASAPTYTLADEWDETWLRLYDRTGRPDPDGPMLQRFDDGLYRRYHFDLTVPDFPMATEARWADQSDGARMWVQSLNEFELANRMQLRTSISTWEDGHIDLGYDRRQDRLTDRHQLRFDIGQRDIADTGVDARLRFHPGWVKNDVDVEAMVRYAVDDLGEASLRLGTLDTFINASFGLVEARGRQLEEHVRHQDIPLTAGAGLRTASWYGVRTELYAGGVIPHSRHHEFRDEPQLDHLRDRRALLAAALLEWSLSSLPVSVGATVESTDAQMDWSYDEEEEERNRSIREATRAIRVYALSRPIETLELEFSTTRTNRPEHRTGPGVADEWRQNPRRSDVEQLTTLRAIWHPHEIAGADIQLLRMNRTTEGPPQLDIDGSFNRLVTRLSLQLGDDVWTSFGVGWTLDPRTAIYDGGGMTLIYTPGPK